MLSNGSIIKIDAETIVPPIHSLLIMSTRRLLVVGYAICILLRISSSAAQNNSRCTSSCGKIRDISFPFRLQGDPSSCGDGRFELECQNNNTILHLKSKRYHVQAITYSNFSIRLTDPGLDNDNYSSCPIQSTSYDDVPSERFRLFLERNVPVAYISCQRPANTSFYLETTFCGNRSSEGLNSNSSRIYSYVAGGQKMYVSDLEESCGVDKVAWVSLSSGYFSTGDGSLSSIHTNLAYGFELSWFRVLCGPCEASHGFCSLNGNTISCRRYCYEDVPLSKLGFKCQFQFWGGIIGTLALYITGALIALRFLCGFPFLLGLVIHKWRKRHLSAYENIEDFLQRQNNLTPIKYTYSEIKKMTNNFRDRLGEGGCGTVFKGKLRSDPFIAVKMMGKSVASGDEFISEVATIGRIHHVNVVQLIGFCVEGSKRALVYEFMPNGSLEKYIFQQGETNSLSYKRMFEISLGIARGIDYLHRGCDMQILHFDIKPHNILLDENLNPKISDFGLAKLCPVDDSIVSLTAARGTMGYMAPELFYKNIGGVSYKADVYSFGMLLMEMAGRRKNMNPFANDLSQIYFPSWVYDQFNEGNDIEMGDATGEEKNMVKKMIIVALWCIQMKPADRPPMNKVVEMLEQDSELLQMPPRPFLLPREMLEDHGKNTTSTEPQMPSCDSVDYMLQNIQS